MIVLKKVQPKQNTVYMLMLEALHSENSEIESEDIAEEIKIPLQALKL